MNRHVDVKELQRVTLQCTELSFKVRAILDKKEEKKTKMKFECDICGEKGEHAVDTKETVTDKLGESTVEDRMFYCHEHLKQLNQD